MRKSPCSAHRPSRAPALPRVPFRRAQRSRPAAQLAPSHPRPPAPALPAAEQRHSAEPRRSGAGAGAQRERSPAGGEGVRRRASERRSLPRPGGTCPFCAGNRHARLRLSISSIPDLMGIKTQQIKLPARPSGLGCPLPELLEGRHSPIVSCPPPPLASKSSRDSTRRHLPSPGGSRAAGTGAQRPPLPAGKRSFPLLRSRRAAPAPSPQPGVPEVSASRSQLGRQRQLHSPRDEEPLTVGGGGRWGGPDSSRDALPRWPPPPPPSSALSGACPPRRVPRCSPAASVCPARLPPPLSPAAANRAAHRPRRRPGGPGGDGGLRPSLLPSPRGLVHTLRGEKRPCPGLTISSGKVTGTAEPSTEWLPPAPPRSLLLLPARRQRPLGAALRPGSLRARAWRPPPTLSARLPPSPSFLPSSPPAPSPLSAFPRRLPPAPGARLPPAGVGAAAARPAGRG